MTTPLAQMIRAHCEMTGDTLADIATRGDLSRQTLSALVNRLSIQQMPRNSTVEKLAVGLGLPVETVRRVIAESAYGGEDPAEHRRVVRVLLAYAQRMPDHNVEVLLATARALEMATTPGPGDGDDETREEPKAAFASRTRLAVLR